MSIRTRPAVHAEYTESLVVHVYQACVTNLTSSSLLLAVHVQSFTYVHCFML